MKKMIKQGLIALSLGLAVTAMGTSVSAATEADFTNQNKAAQSERQLAKVYESYPKANCLELFASLYLGELEDQHAKELSQTEMRALAVAQMQTTPLAVHADSLPVASTASAAAQTVKDAAKATAKPVATPSPKATAKPAATKTPANASNKPAASKARTIVTNTGKSLSYKKMLSITATAYSASASENGGWAGLDYFGGALKLGTIAVDPKIIPLGSTVYITGYTASGLPVKGMIGKATDIGGAIKGKRIDIFIPGSQSLVDSFGIQNVQVYIL